MQYLEIKKGTGLKPIKGDKVEIYWKKNIKGKDKGKLKTSSLLLDAKDLPEKVIEGLLLMREGSIYKLKFNDLDGKNEWYIELNKIEASSKQKTKNKQKTKKII